MPHYLSDEQRAFADMSDEIEPNLIIDDTRILIIIEKNELAKLKENAELFDATKTYLKGYINALKENAEQIRANLINEEQIIEYLRHNDEARKGIKQILDTELSYIKTHHPDFIQKWKYYLEFEKMCAELDGCEFANLFPQESNLIVSGYLGDAVFGDSYLPEKKFYNKRVNAEIAEFYYGDFAEFSGYDDEYYNVANPLPIHWINRGSNFINMAVSADVGRTNIACRPFFDNKIIEFVCSLPNEYLFEYRLYKHLVLRHYPKFFKHIGRNSLMPLYTKRNLNYLVNKSKLKINKKLQKLGFIPKVIESYADYEKWIMQEPYKSQIEKYLLSKDAFYRRFTNEIMNLYVHKERDGYADKILKLVSVEMYFEEVMFDL